MKLACSPRFLSSLVLSLLLISPAIAQRKEATNKTLPGSNTLSLQQQDALDLLKTLAQELKSEADKPAAASLQARIADVLWQYDDLFAKEVFRWAFDAAKKPPSEDLTKAARATYIARQANSLREVLSRLGSHDQKRAEAWLKSLEEIPGSSLTCSSCSWDSSNSLSCSLIFHLQLESCASSALNSDDWTACCSFSTAACSFASFQD